MDRDAMVASCRLDREQMGRGRWNSPSPSSCTEYIGNGLFLV